MISGKPPAAPRGRSDGDGDRAVPHCDSAGSIIGTDFGHQKKSGLGRDTVAAEVRAKLQSINR
jgi:hypothetical protein